MTFTLRDKGELIRFLRRQEGEKDWIEFKQGNDDPESIAKYVSGLANSAMYESAQFAYLLWGISDTTNEIVGTDVNLRKKKVGNADLLFWLNGRLSPRINLTIESIDVDGKNIELLCIEPSYTAPIAASGQEYIRIGTSLTPLRDNHERSRAIWLACSRFSFEEQSLLHHISVDELQDRFGLAALQTLPGLKGLATSVDPQTLGRYGLVRPDDQGAFDATVLLGLSVARSLDDFHLLERKGIRVSQFKGTSKAEGLADVHGRRGYAIAFDTALAQIMDRLKIGEEFIDGRRAEIYQIPEIAVREFLANAIIHQDLVSKGDGPVVEIFSDKLKISNPGGPLVPIDRFIDSPSRSRNAKFGKLMRDLGFCEERSSGIDRALNAIEAAVLPPPLFEEVADHTVVTLPFRRSFSDMTPEERIRACFHHACLRYEQGEPMSNASLRERFGLADRQYPQVSTVIREATDAGRIKPREEGQSKRFARYVPYYA